jgi:co-chaperonin GroES (HSP10)
MAKKKTPLDKIHAVGWRILLKPRELEEKTERGIILPDSVRDVEQFGEIVLQVVDVGPEAYADSRFKRPWVKAGDWVVIARHAGWRITVPTTKEDFRVINDDGIIAVVDDPDVLG